MPANDTLIKGFPFDGATGLKTGANLEDLVTRAILTAGSEMLDGVFLTTILDAGENKATIKDLSIIAAKIAAATITEDKLAFSTVLGGPIIAAADGTNFGNVTQTGWAANPIADATDWTEATDEDETLISTIGTRGSNAMTIEVDLGAVFKGSLWFSAKVTGNASTSQSALFVYNDTASVLGSEVGTQFDNVFRLQTASATTRQFILPFVGRSVGVTFGATAGLAVQVKRFEVHGVAL